MNNFTKYLFIALVVIFITCLAIISIVVINNISQKEKNKLKDLIIKEAKAHFNNILITRSWNASYGGVYVDEKDGMKPNPYLVENTKLDANGNVMIKIDPAWMTKQISDLINKKEEYYYKITSLNPINPSNKPDKFETKALKYFESNKDKRFYYEFDKKLDFMGALKVDESCLKCHAHQGYKIGDIRGGIRVSIPIDIYKASISSIENHKKNHIIILIIVTIFFTTMALYILKLLYNFKFQKDALKKKDELLERAQNIANFGFWQLNFQNNNLVLSSQLYRLLKLDIKKSKITYESFLELIHPDDRDIVKEAYRFSLKMKEPYEITYKLQTGDNDIRYVTQKCETSFDKNGEPIESIGTIQDITELHEVYDQLRKKDEIMIAQSRHAAMGEMISMLAHQWRQPITVIAMQANNIIADVELDLVDKKELLVLAKEILDQTNELSKTIDDFRDSFKPQKNLEVINIKDIIEESLIIVGKSIENNGIELEVRIEDNIYLNTYSRELIQVIISILKNAKEILIEKEIEAKKINIYVENKNDLVILYLCDNGGGIKKEISHNIFEPYFSTKDEKNGTGLDMYISKIIVEKHLKGELSFINKNGGVCFNIILPAYLVQT